MIKIGEGGLTDLWPDKSSIEVQCISYALQQAVNFVKTKAEETRCYSSTNDIKENILDHMAVELRTMYYDQNMSMDEKRNIIKNTLKWYMKAGTASAVEEMVSVIFGDAKITEWFDFQDWPYTAGTFDIETMAQITEGIYIDIERYIRKVKNTRSHLRKIKFIRDETMNLYHCGIIRTSETESVVDDHKEYNANTNGSITAAAFVYSELETVVNNHFTYETEMSGRMYQGIGIYASPEVAAREE